MKPIFSLGNNKNVSKQTIPDAINTHLYPSNIHLISSLEFTKILIDIYGY